MRLRNWQIVCFAALCLLAMLSGCGKEAAMEQVSAETSEADGEQTIAGVSVRIPSTQYRLTRTELEGIDFGELLLPHAGGAVLIGDTFTQEEAETVRSSSAAVWYSQDGTTAVQALPVSADGLLVRAALEEDRLLYLEQAGETQWILHTGDTEASLNDALTGCSYISAMAVRGGTVYLAADAAWMIACKPDGELLWKQAAPEISSFFSAQDGRLLAWARQEQAIYAVEEDTILAVCALPALFCTGTEQLYPGKNTPYDCIVCAGDAVFGWSIADASVTQLFTCDEVGLYAMDMEAFCGMGNGQYLGLEYDPSAADEGGQRLFWLTQAEDDLSEKRIVRVAGSRSSILSMAIRDFASMYPEYQIEYVDYDALYGEQAEQRLLMDMLYGECPDLLFVNGLPFEQYARQGLLEDLYAYLDADETLSRADLTQNLLCALETDGALYRLPQTYLLDTAIGLRETVGGMEGWSMTEFLDSVQTYPELASVFAREDGQGMLELLLLHAPTAFMNYETAEAKFDLPDFLRLLTLAEAQKQPDAGSGWEALQNGDTLLEELMITRAEEFEEQYTSALQDCAFPGFPGAGQASFYLTLPMAIPVNAREKAGAWAFLKLLITEDLYATRSRGGWLPLQADFEEKTAAMTDSAAQTLLRELQQTAQTVFYYDEAVQTILREELPYFFAGDQTADQIADRIQRRVQLYLQETYR